MPPLDTGSVAHTLRLVDPLSDRAELAPADFQTVGAYLRAVRERSGHSLADLAEATRIRKVYLAAIEEGDVVAQPSRPFAVGYVRAYARALDIDGEAAAERFKRETPDASEPLRAPIGVKHENRERRPLFFAAAAVLVAAVVGWNIVQRSTTVASEPAPPPLPAAVPPAEALSPQGPISLGAPTPPPPEQTTPAPYVTPGLEKQAADASATPAPPAPVVAEVVAAAAGAAPAVFSTRASVYGPAAGGQAVVLQARKPASLIIRGAGGEVYFARQLAAGEAYRAPIGRKLSAEASDPGAFSVYINDQLHGSLAVAQTSLDKVAAEIVRTAPASPAPAPPAAPPAPRAPAAATTLAATVPVAAAPAPAPAAAVVAPASEVQAPASVGAPAQ